MRPHTPQQRSAAGLPTTHRLSHPAASFFALIVSLAILAAPARAGFLVIADHPYRFGMDGRYFTLDESRAVLAAVEERDSLREQVKILEAIVEQQAVQIDLLEAASRDQSAALAAKDADLFRCGSRLQRSSTWGWIKFGVGCLAGAAVLFAVHEGID